MLAIKKDTKKITNKAVHKAWVKSAIKEITTQYPKLLKKLSK